MRSKPKLILVDLDGTLVGSDGKVSDRNAAALKRATAAGTRVVVATGRPARIVLPLRESLGSTLALCYNGAVVLDLATEQVLEAHLLDGTVFRDAVRRVRADGHKFVVAVEGTPDIGIRAEKGFREGMPIPRGTLDELCAIGIVKGLIRVDPKHFDAVWNAFVSGHPDTLEVTRSGVEGLIEISAAGVSKGGVIAGLAEQWGIDPSDAIAFGDMPNDLEMFRWAGWSVAMGNAEAEVKSAASEVTAHHDSDGVAEVLERWF